MDQGGPETLGEYIGALSAPIDREQGTLDQGTKGRDTLPGHETPHPSGWTTATGTEGAEPKRESHREERRD